MANEELQRRSRRVRVFWIVAATVIVIAIGLSLLPDRFEVDAAKADRGDVRVEVVDEGRTRMHDVYVISAPVTGRVLRVEVEPGDEVGAGAVVARMSRAAAGFLDTRSDLQARAAVSAAEAQLRSAQADLGLAEREHRRNTELVAANLISKAAADESEARLDAARAARDAAKAEVARAKSALLDPARMASGVVNVTSPSAGRVLRVPQESEAVIATGTPIVEVGDPQHVEIVAEFLSQDAVRMKPGAPAQIENWGGPPLPAVVDRVEPVARTKISALGVEEQRTNVILQFKGGPGEGLQAHDFRVDVRVVIREAKNAIRVPLGALFRQGAGWALYKIVDGKAALTEVEVAEADPHFRVVTSGVNEGDAVIVFPSISISDGVRVKPRKQVPKPAPQDSPSLPARRPDTIRSMNTATIGAALTAATLLTGSAVCLASPEEDRVLIAAIDTKYQEAVKRNDADTMAQILHDDFILVLGSGKTHTRADLLNEARSGRIKYEQQDEDPGTQTVRVWGDTAVVTARLWLKGVAEGKPFERRLWFSDTYVRTPQGWRYAFGQASLALP